MKTAMDKSMKAKGKRGRKKEKVQISVRIDKTIMDLARGHLDRNPAERITELIERGMLLAMREQSSEPDDVRAPRLIFQEMSVERRRRATRVFILDCLPEVTVPAPTSAERCLLALHSNVVDSLEHFTGFNAAVTLLGGNYQISEDLIRKPISLR